MKTRAKTLLTLTASALTLLAPLASSAAEAPAHSHANNAAEPETTDTLVYSATKTLIESFSELSKTASKLSETALKLLEAQEQLDAKRAGNPQQDPASAKKSNDKKTKPKKYAENSDIDNSDNSLKEIAEEITIIGSELAPATQQPQLQPSSALNIIPADSQTAVSNGANYPSSNVYYTDEVTQQTSVDENIWYLPQEKKEGGQYLWIPDAQVSTIQSVLNGEPVSQSQYKPAIDLNEMTYWRGDSIHMALPTKRLGRFDRKLYNWLIYPKGLWHIGLTANYGELSTDDSEFLSLIQDVDLKGKIYSIKPSVSYFLRNNVCVGMRLAFTKGEMGINSFKVDIDEDMSFNLHDIKYTSDSYAAALFIQQYFGLSRRGRFAVFNEAEISVGTGNAHFIRPFDGDIRDTRTKTQSFNINYSPGVSIMMMKNAAFNLSFGIFGFHLKSEKQWENGEESGNRFTSGINFRFNIFNINFGVAIII